MTGFKHLHIFTNRALLQLSLAGVFLLSSVLIYGQGFVDVTQLDGMTITHDGEDPSVIGGDIGSGAAWIDYNGDSYLDLYITMRTGANLLFKNEGPDVNGNITWDEVAAAAGVQDASNDGAGVAVGDYNNDGLDDLYLANVSEDVLFKNNGDGTFTDVTAGSGLTATGDSRGNSASWGDYDNDGYLDLYVTQYTPYPGATNATHHDFLFHNNGGNGSFTNVSSLLGASELVGYGFIGGWVDYDNDGDMDIILINDCITGSPDPDADTHTRIFRNDSHLSTHWLTWEFEEESAAIGVNDCRNGMGLAVGDLNRDGWLDFAYTNIGDCILFKNDGDANNDDVWDGNFSDISTAAGINGQNALHYSWGTAFFDYDLDGWQDLYFVLGSLWDTGAAEPKPNELYKNNGDDTFTDMAASLNMDDSAKSRSGIFADYDNDGDIDVFLLNYGEQCILKENTNNNGNNWVQVKLTGTDSNKNGIGARLKLTDNNNVTQYYEIRSGSNLGGGDDMRAYFGLGNATSITELEIQWPSGSFQIVSPLPAINTLNNVVEENNGPLPVELAWFSAEKNKSEVLLEWGTFSEVKNDYFTVQRSKDGRNFENIGTVEGAGTTTAFYLYSYLDKNPLEGDNYYRIQQTDFDGAHSWSEIKLVSFEQQKPQVSVHPNPVVNGEITLAYQGTDQELKVEIYDMMGRLAYQNRLQNIDSAIETKLNVGDFSNGVYFLSLSGRDCQETLKLIVNQ